MTPKKKRKQPPRTNIERTNKGPQVSAQPESPEIPPQVGEVQFSYQEWQGVIPHPEHLRQFNEIIPNGADRIMKQAEGQSKHRMRLESFVVGFGAVRSGAGLVAGFIFAMFVAREGFDLMGQGELIAGGVIVSLDVAGIVGAFVYGRQQQSQERVTKLGLIGRLFGRG